jgi:hypothetical protein
MLKPISLLTGLLVLGALPWPALALLDRYPTAEEMQSLTRQFQQNILRPNLYPRDRRTPVEKRKISDFQQAWAKVDPTVAPFLGNWSAIEESKMIYPSTTKGKVCIIETFIGDQGTGVDFALGTVINGQVRVSDLTILIQQGNFLGTASTYQDQASVYEYMNPRSLQHPFTLSYLKREPKIIQQFVQAGCTADRPK